VRDSSRMRRPVVPVVLVALYSPSEVISGKGWEAPWQLPACSGLFPQIYQSPWIQAHKVRSKHEMQDDSGAITSLEPYGGSRCASATDSRSMVRLDPGGGISRREGGAARRHCAARKALGALAPQPAMYIPQEANVDVYISSGSRILDLNSTKSPRRSSKANKSPSNTKPSVDCLYRSSHPSHGRALLFLLLLLLLLLILLLHFLRTSLLYSDYGTPEKVKMVRTPPATGKCEACFCETG